MTQRPGGNRPGTTPPRVQRPCCRRGSPAGGTWHSSAAHRLVKVAQGNLSHPSRTPCANRAACRRTCLQVQEFARWMRNPQTAHCARWNSGHRCSSGRRRRHLDHRPARHSRTRAQRPTVTLGKCAVLVQVALFGSPLLATPLTLGKCAVLIQVALFESPLVATPVTLGKCAVLIQAALSGSPLVATPGATSGARCGPDQVARTMHVSRACPLPAAAANRPPGDEPLYSVSLDVMLRSATFSRSASTIRRDRAVSVVLQLHDPWSVALSWVVCSPSSGEQRW
mgnify:CR=1 FL=1